MKLFIQKNWFRLVLSFSIILTSISIFIYSYGNYTQKEKRNYKKNISDLQYEDIIKGHWEMRPSDNNDNGQAIFDNGRLQNFENGRLRGENNYRIINDTIYIDDNRRDFGFKIEVINSQTLKLISLDQNGFYINCTRID